MIIFIEFYWFAFVLCISILQTIKMFENKFHIFILFMISKLSWKKTQFSTDMDRAIWSTGNLNTTPKRKQIDIAEVDRYLKSSVMERLSTSK